MNAKYALGICLIVGLALPGPAQAILLDFDFDGLGAPILAGQVVDTEYDNLGVLISADNFTLNHPDKAIAFNSASPTGGDTDLATPGYHPSNTVPYGMLLIIAENDIDANANGYIDDPDDEANRPAGWIKFGLSGSFSEASLTLVDIEEVGGSIIFRLGGSTVTTLSIPTHGDNSVQTLALSGTSFDEIQVNLGGSGAIAEMSIVPEPTTLGLLAIGGVLLARRRRGR